MAVYCSRCGSENPDDSKFCYHCGARFAERVIPPEHLQPTQVVEPQSGDDLKHSDVSREQSAGRAEGLTDAQPLQTKNEGEPAVHARRDSSFEFPAYNQQDHRPGLATLRYAPASFIARFGAFFIDLVVLSIMTKICLMMADSDFKTIANDSNAFGRLWDENMHFALTGDMGTYLSEFWHSYILLLGLQILLAFTYYLVFHAICGQTPGKFALGIKVTRTDGSPIGFGRSFFRYIVYWFGSKALYMDSFWALFNNQVATWHDLACDTRVYRVSSLEGEEPDHI